MTREQLLAHRLRLGLSQGRLAELTGKGRSSVNRYETGKRPIPRTFALAVQALLSDRATTAGDKDG